MKRIRILVSIVALVAASSGDVMAYETTLATQKPTAQMIEEAKKNPNGWVYAIEGNFGPNDAVPPEAIAGAWKVGPEGKIIEDSFMANPKFKAVRQ